MNWAKIIAFLAISVVAGAQTQPPPPQTARQAVLEMLLSKDPKAFQKHIPENAQEIFKKTDSGLLPLLMEQVSNFQLHGPLEAKHMETFDVGPLLLVSESSVGHQQERVEVVVERDDLSGDEDQIELSLRVYDDGVIHRMPVVPGLTLDMKEEKDVWRLSQITVAIKVPLTDTDYVKGIADDMHKTRQRMAEFQTVSSLQQLKAGEIARQKNSSSGYVCNLADLSNPGPGGRGESAPDYTYKIADCSSSGFHIIAEPAKDSASRRAFCIDEAGPVRFADDGKGSTCVSSGRPLSELQATEWGRPGYMD
jgi:hypothetical protein